MHGIHSVGRAPTARDTNVAFNVQLQALIGPFIGRVRSLRLSRAATAFTSPALLRELVARLERARLQQQALVERSASSRLGVALKPARWCGASPLERKRAAWRERRHISK